jgi:branched-chain amino acid transport system permease protein
MTAALQILQIIIDGLSAGALYALLALGLSLVFSVMGLINFAYGSQIVWAGYAAVVLVAAGIPYPIALGGMAIASIVLSVAIGDLVFLPFVGSHPSTLLLASFGVALALQAMAVMVFGDVPRVVPSPPVLSTSIEIGGLHISVLQIVALLISATVLFSLDLLIRLTQFGIEARAAAEDAATTSLMGVSSRRVVLFIFVLSGLIAAVVAFVWFSQVGTVTPRSGFNPTLKAFIAVVLGGLGTVRGAVYGGLALGLIESILAATLNDNLLAYQEALAFALIIGVLILRPQGIAGRLLQVSK